MNRTRVFSLASAALALAPLLVGALDCGPDGVRSTGPARTSFMVWAQGVRGTETLTSRGWRVRYEQALVAPGPLRWFEGQPLFDARAPSPRPRGLFVRALGAFLSPSIALAHPGHYVPGEALADLTTRRVVDLAAGARVPLGMADGVTVMANSATIELHPARDDLGTEGARLAGHTLVVRGEAQREGVLVRFEGGLDGDFVIRGVPAHGMLDGTQGGWALEVDLSALLDRADFSQLPMPATEGGYAAVGNSGQVFNALYRGASSAAAYTLVPDVSAGARDH